jgi:hypothetical protein
MKVRATYDRSNLLPRASKSECAIMAVFLFLVVLKTLSPADLARRDEYPPLSGFRVIIDRYDGLGD